MTNVRDTSIKSYDEIKQEEIYDNDMEMVLQAIRQTPLMTGREYAQIVLNYDDMNKVRPRISDLYRLGYIIAVGKRQCSLSKRTAYIWTTLEGIEKLCLRKLGFAEKTPNVFLYFEGDAILYQDFRNGKRRSFAFKEYGTPTDYKELEIHKQFKEMLNFYIQQYKNGENK